MRFLKIFFLPFLISLYSLALSQQVNLAPNPSFEETTGKNPAGWTSLNPQKTSIETATYRSGKKSLAIFRTIGPQGEQILAGWESQPIKIEEGNEYILQGFVKTANATGYTYLSLAFYEGNKFIEEDISEILSGDNDWQNLYFVSLPPPKATNLRIRFFSQGNSGTAYLDDVLLIAVPRKEYDINLAPNPSFEAGLDDNPYDWEIAREWGDNAEQFRSRQFAHKGIYSLLINVSSKGARMAGWKSKGFPVFPGKLYKFTSWVKTNNASGETYLVIAWFSDRGWIGNSYHGFFLTSNNDWTKLSVSDVPPKDATYAILYLRSDDNPGSAWFDDVKLNISDSLLSEIDVPNSSFEVDSDFWQPWLSEGHCREMKVDDTFAYEGKRSLMISDVSGTVAWQSRGMRLFSNEKYLYRLSCKVRTIGEGGKVSIWIAWFGEGGWIKNSESIPAPPNSDGWVELSLSARPPEGARSLEIYLGCQDFKGTAWFDDVRMEQMIAGPEERKGGEIPLEYAIAKHFNSIFTVSPDRLFESFEEAFPDKDDAKKILDNLTTILSKDGKLRNNETLLSFAILNYHLGNYRTALISLNQLKNRFIFTDIREDIIMHYLYWTQVEVERLRREEKAKTIEERIRTAKQGTSDWLRTLQQCASDYWDLWMWKEARETYQLLLQSNSLPSSEIPQINYRIAISYFLEKKYKEAVDKLSDFISKHPDNLLSQGASLYLAKSLRLSGNPSLAIPHLKKLWPEKISDELRWQLEREAGKCYVALRDDPKMVEDYKSFFKQGAIPGALYIGSDTETLGDWIGRYGDFAYILCAMGGYPTSDIISGIRKANKEEIEGKIKISPKDGALQPPVKPDELVYLLQTTDPAEPGRYNFIRNISSSISALFNPTTKSYSEAFWDDRGETHPFDGKGPNFLIDIIGIPKGVFRLSLYMREHEVRIMDDEEHTLAVKPRKEERSSSELPNLYESFVIFGPINIRIHIIKGKSSSTVLSGIFLDKLIPPKPLPEIKVGREEKDGEKLAIFNKAREMYEEMRKRWEEDPYSYYQNLSRFSEIIENLEKFISLSPDSKEAVLAQWMLWQCFLQLPGKHKEAEKALMRYIDLYLSLKGKS